MVSGWSVRLEVSTAVNVKIVVLSDVTSCSLAERYLSSVMSFRTIWHLSAKLHSFTPKETAVVILSWYLKFTQRFCNTCKPTIKGKLLSHYTFFVVEVIKHEHIHWAIIQI
jgi:hypothetical protein